MTVHFGVVALGHVLGEPVDVAAAAAGYTSDVDRVLGWGYRTFHRAADGVGLTDLAAEAGAKALANAGVRPDEVDLVVLALSDLSEHLYWDAAGATQAKIGANGSEAVLLTQACGGGVAAFDIVAGKFATHPDYRTALIIGANRVCETYWNRMEINTSIFSDGAAAAVVQRDHPHRRWINTEIISDGRYADFMMMDIGAAARPFTGQDPAEVRVKSPQARLEEFFAGDIRKMFEFVSTIRTNNHEVVRRACKRAGITPSDVRRLLHLHDSVPALTLLAKDLDMGLEWTNASVATAHGHVGCADQLMSLELVSEELASGDVVALTSTASGMHWLCTLLEI